MMPLKSNMESVQDKELKSLLVSLAKSQELLKENSDREEIYQQLEKIYCNPNKNEEKYRHFYSDIFIILTQIVQGDYPEADIVVLGENIRFIYDHYSDYKEKTCSTVDIGDNIRKLYDHVSLDIARIRYSETLYRKMAGAEEVADLKGRYGLIEQKITKAEKRIKSVKNKLGEVQKEYIVILGIFSSIVITFVAGMAFSTSIIGNIDKASIYRLTFIVALVGLGLFNLVNLLLTFIHRITNDNTAGDSKEILGIDRINKVIWTIIGVDCIAWAIYWMRFGAL